MCVTTIQLCHCSLETSLGNSYSLVWLCSSKTLGQGHENLNFMQLSCLTKDCLLFQSFKITEVIFSSSARFGPLDVVLTPPPLIRIPEPAIVQSSDNPGVLYLPKDIYSPTQRLYQFCIYGLGQVSSFLLKSFSHLRSITQCVYIT